MIPETLPRTSKIVALGRCAANWVVPGLGFLLSGDITRGLILMILISGCFAIGVSFGGFILIPAWSIRDPEFNLVSILTYLVQAFCGGGWMLMQGLQQLASGDPNAYFNLQKLSASNTYSDLGSFHFVVAGGLNYFATMRLYDLLAGHPEERESKKTENKPAETETSTN